MQVFKILRKILYAYLVFRILNITVKMSTRCTLTFLTDLHSPTIRTWFAARKSICTI